jgi:PAS domain S-box-containing protein
MQGPLFQARGGCPFLASRPDLANSVPPHPLPNTESMMSCPASSSPSSSYSASELSIDNVPEPSVTPETISLFNVMDDLLECVVVSDANGIILRANTAAQKLFGYTAQELVGNNVAMLCEPEIARIHHTFLDRYLDTRRPVVIGTAGRDVRGQHKNGTLLPLRLSVAETRQSGSTLFVAQLHDLRPIKQREEELRVLSQLNKTVAERASADIHERIMHSVAHELRNPLQTIMGSLYMLQSSLSSISPSDKESLEDIQEAIRKCCSVLDNAVLVCNYQKTKLTQNSSFELANVSDVLVDVRKQLDFFTPVHIRLEIDKSVPPQAFFNVTHTRQVRFLFLFSFL